MIKIFLLLYMLLASSSGAAASNDLQYKEFRLWAKKAEVLQILNSSKYAQYSIYKNNNDIYFGGLRVEPENSIKIIMPGYMNKEEILLVFNEQDILLDIYARIKPADIRDFIDYRNSMVTVYGSPVEEETSGNQKILTWRFKKQKLGVYLIYNSKESSLIINCRDNSLMMKYTQKKSAERR